LLAKFTAHCRVRPSPRRPRAWSSGFGPSLSLLLFSISFVLVCSIDLLRILVRISFFNFHWAEPFAPSRPSSDGGSLRPGKAGPGSPRQLRRGVEDGGWRRRRGRGWRGRRRRRRAAARRSDGRAIVVGATATWVEFCGGFHAEAAKNTFTPSDYETEERDSPFRFQFDRLEACLTLSARPTPQSRPIPVPTPTDRPTEPSVHPSVRVFPPLAPSPLSPDTLLPPLSASTSLAEVALSRGCRRLHGGFADGSDITLRPVKGVDALIGWGRAA